MNWTAISAAGSWAQAIFTAAAVFAAAWLQDRAFEKREMLVRSERLEGVASIARYMNDACGKIFSSLTDGMDPEGLFFAGYPNKLAPIQRAARSVEAAKLPDIQLAYAVLKLEEVTGLIEGKINEIGRIASVNRPTSRAVDARALIGQLDVELFNAAASVERRVAQINRRNPLL